MKDEDFVLHASDRKGHSIKVSLRIPTEQDHALQKVFDNRNKLNLPYTTKADIMRDAIAHRLDWLQKQFGAPIKTDLARLMAIENILQDEEYKKRFLASFETLRGQVNWLLNQGDEASKQHARELVQQVYEQICAMQGYWRERAMQTIKMEFGHLLKPWNMALREEEE